MGILDINEDEEYIQKQPEGTGELALAICCSPCYTAARTRYGCKALVFWFVFNIIFMVLGGGTLFAATSQVEANTNMVSTAPVEIETQVLLARLERDIDAMN